MEFVVDALPVELIGMNSTMMCNYIKFCADRLLLFLGCERHFKIGNPFEWMDLPGNVGIPATSRDSCVRPTRRL